MWASINHQRAFLLCLKFYWFMWTWIPKWHCDMRISDAKYKGVLRSTQNIRSNTKIHTTYKGNILWREPLVKSKELYNLKLNYTYSIAPKIREKNTSYNIALVKTTKISIHDFPTPPPPSFKRNAIGFSFFNITSCSI